MLSIKDCRFKLEAAGKLEARFMYFQSREFQHSGQGIDSYPMAGCWEDAEVVGSGSLA